MTSHEPRLSPLSGGDPADRPGGPARDRRDHVLIRNVRLIAESGLFDRAWYVRRRPAAAADPILHFLESGGRAGHDPHPLFDSEFYLAANPDVAAAGVNPFLHFLRYGAAEGRAPHPLFDTAWYLKNNPDVARIGMNPLAHYLARGWLERRSPHPLFGTSAYPSLSDPSHAKGASPLLEHLKAGVRDAAVAPESRREAPEPDLFDLRAVEPRGRIAVVLHLYYADLWDEMQSAIRRIDRPFDLFVSLVTGASDGLKTTVKQAFPDATVFECANRGRDIGPFVSLLRSGVLFKYELICKLHGKRGPGHPRHRGTAGPLSGGDGWRRDLVGGILGDSGEVDRIVAAFAADPDLGMVVADGNIFAGREYWTANERLLGELLVRLGIPGDVAGRRFPGGSIFWIRAFLLRTLAGLNLGLADFEPEPLQADGCLVHAVERLFGLICEDAGMTVAERSSLAPRIAPRPGGPSKVHVVAYYLPQYHPIPENDRWWGPGFTEWTNVVRARPRFRNHRQPRLPADLGFYDLRLADVREAQAALARRYGLAAFCYYYYWFDGRRILERPLDAVRETGKPDFPFLICWANEPWTRNWDGLAEDVLLPQTYGPGWIASFARDVAPLLDDRRYFRLDGKPVLLIYRIGHIPDAAAAIRELRAALARRDIPEVHLAAAWVWFPDDSALPDDPGALGLDAYFEFPPHRLPAQPLRPSPSGMDGENRMKLYDYARTAAAAISGLAGKVAGRRHRSVMLGWDNTARAGARAHVFHGATPASFRFWLRKTIDHERRLGGERIVFVNAWNEWAEGAHLEPDQDFGLGWLEAVGSATQAGSGPSSCVS